MHNSPTECRYKSQDLNRIYLSTYLKLHFPQPFLTHVPSLSFSLQVGDNVRNFFGVKSLAICTFNPHISLLPPPG